MDSETTNQQWLLPQKLNPPTRLSQDGVFLCWRKKSAHFSWESFVTGTSKSGSCEFKVSSPLEMDAFESFTLIPISACVILASFDTCGHTSLFLLPKHYLPAFVVPYCSAPPSQPALIRVMPAHHGTIWATRRIMGLHTGYNTTCSWVSKGEGGAASPSMPL